MANFEYLVIQLVANHHPSVHGFYPCPEYITKVSDGAAVTMGQPSLSACLDFPANNKVDIPPSPTLSISRPYANWSAAEKVRLKVGESFFWLLDIKFHVFFRVYSFYISHELQQISR